MYKNFSLNLIHNPNVLMLIILAFSEKINIVHKNNIPSLTTLTIFPLYYVLINHLLIILLKLRDNTNECLYT